MTGGWFRLLPGAIALQIAAAGGVCAHQRPLQRAFSPGAQEEYRIEVTLRTEVRGVSAETIGAKSYVKPFVHAAEGMLHWTAVRRISRVAADGTAEIEESVDVPAGECPRSSTDEQYDEALRQALQRFCQSWSEARVLRYREGGDGLIRDYPKDAAPNFGEQNLFLLALWARHAWTPSVILPSMPLRIGERRQKKSSLNNPAWEPGEGSETTEWLPASGDAPAANLHVIQQLTSGEQWILTWSGSSKPEQRRGHESFFAESLSTVSLLDGSLLDATRSAARETTWTLDPVEGLPEPPAFAKKISVTVTIHRLR